MSEPPKKAPARKAKAKKPKAKKAPSPRWKYPTPAGRKAVFQELLIHLRGGFGWKNFPKLSNHAIKRYRDRFPKEFVPEQMDEAFREGSVKLQQLLIDVARGYSLVKNPATGQTERVPVKGNAVAAIYLLKNRGFSDNPDHAALDYEDAPVIAFGKADGEAGGVAEQVEIVIQEVQLPPKDATP